MKIEKEYPATHSMSTAWYVADKDGNVAIMDFNDNGPVPWEIEQTCIQDLVFGHCEDYKHNDYITINLTDDQIDDLMENPHQPKDEDLWIECIFQIDLEQEEEFLNLAQDPDFEIELCISKKRGLYLVDCLHCTEVCGKKYAVKDSSSLKKMINLGMIKQIYNVLNFFSLSEEWVDDKVVFEHRFSSAPYYIYAQPYWNELLAERINTPANPVKIDQFPLPLRNRIPRVPIRFSEYQRFQIAEWHPCCFNCEEEIYINGFIYKPIVLTNGTEAYVYTSLGEIDFYDYCSEKSYYKCKECSSKCYTAKGNEYSDRPTVMFVFHPFSNYDYKMCVKSDVIIRHSVRIPFLHKIPYKDPRGYWVFKDEAMKHVSEEMLETFLMKNYQHFEDTILRINPQVIILEENTKDILCQQILMDDRNIWIKGNVFPYYLIDEIEKNREEITRLASLPYRGIEMPYIISKEEMKKYKKENNE